MALTTRFKRSAEEEPGLIGTARIERDLKNLGSRAGKGDVVVIDQPDLDRLAAETLVARGVTAVVNAAPSVTGRFPNLGPQILADAGVVLIDFVGTEIFDRLKNGDSVRLHEGNVIKDGNAIAGGAVLDKRHVAGLLRSAEDGLGTQLEALSANASNQMRRERGLFLEGKGVPELPKSLRGRPCVVVAHAYDFASDLKAIRRYIADNDPVLIGAGAGADVLLDAGHTPHLVVGELDNLSDRALRESGEVVVTSPSGQFGGAERLEKAGADAFRLTGTGADEDLAMLLADTNAATVIIAVGAHSNLVEFLDRSQTQMASSFLTRLRIGGKLVDAKAVGDFYDHRFSLWPLVLLLLAGAAAVMVAVATTPTGGIWFDDLGAWTSDLLSSIQGFFT